MRIVVLGLGYLGLTTAVGLAGSGHVVVGVERDAARLHLLCDGRVPFHEPSLDGVLTTAVSGGALSFAPNLAAVPGAVDVVVVAVGSPALPDGGADLDQIERALDEVLAFPPLSVVMVKSSIPPGTSDAWRAGRFDRLAPRYVYVPEFLNQGTAMRDWLEPDRIVLGGWDRSAVRAARGVFVADTTYVLTTPVVAETIKYASNSYLAMRIGFANELAEVCDAVGADIATVLHGTGLDRRIGGRFWRPGIGYGDSCLGKDVSALIHRAAGHGVPMPIMEAVQAANRARHLRPLAILRQERPGLRWPPKVAVLGVAYEPHSDDIRAAPSLSLIPQLRLVAAELSVWDPLLDQGLVEGLFPYARVAGSPREAVRDADAVVVLTEYPEVTSAGWLVDRQAAGRRTLVIDGKNCVPVTAVDPAVTTYRGVGGARLPRG